LFQKAQSVGGFFANTLYTYMHGSRSDDSVCRLVHRTVLLLVHLIMHPQ